MGMNPAGWKLSPKEISPSAIIHVTHVVLVAGSMGQRTTLPRERERVLSPRTVLVRRGCVREGLIELCPHPVAY